MTDRLTGPVVKASGRLSRLARLPEETSGKSYTQGTSGQFLKTCRVGKPDG